MEANLAWEARDKGQLQTAGALFGQLDDGLGLALALVPLSCGLGPTVVASQCFALRLWPKVVLALRLWTNQTACHQFKPTCDSIWLEGR